jgi:hypothetical protein
MLVFFLSEGAYYSLIWYCCDNLGSYQVFHDKMHEYFSKIGTETGDTMTNMSSHMSSLVGLICFSDSEAAPEGRTENQPSLLPPPYWVSPLLASLYARSHFTLDRYETHTGNRIIGHKTS